MALTACPVIGRPFAWPPTTAIGGMGLASLIKFGMSIYFDIALLIAKNRAQCRFFASLTNYGHSWSWSRWEYASIVAVLLSLLRAWLLMRLIGEQRLTAFVICRPRSRPFRNGSSVCKEGQGRFSPEILVVSVLTQESGAVVDAQGLH